MADEMLLLRMLEPAVRPVEGPSSVKVTDPFEARDFEALLHDALDAAAQADQVTAQDDDTMLLAPLAGLDRIENESLRRLIGGGSGL